MPVSESHGFFLVLTFTFSVFSEVFSVHIHRFREVNLLFFFKDNS